MIDLHLHSNQSDGTLSPAELVRMAAKKKLRAISITDHDTISGTEEAVEEGCIQNVSIISGLELSVVHGNFNFHLLGYGFDWKNKQLIKGLELLQESRNSRNIKILEQLKKMGIEISPQELNSESGQGQTGRPHIARLLVKKGIVKTIDQAFYKFLKKDGSAYVTRFIYHVEQAIDLIRQAGGTTSLAHPVQFGYSLEGLPQLLSELKLLGLGGIEVYYPTQKGKIRKKLKELALRFELFETGGSDYHGDIRPGTSMAGGVKFDVPEELYERLLIHISAEKNKNS